ncbi:MAG: Flagellin [bacterium ADurb.Bin236]|nr:MAG: Flagellin [bacterium ADurb.Bin236]HPN93247.1 flagellin [bacterium]
MSVVNTNISGLIGLNNLRLTNLGLQTSLERLSSGLRINHASDDPSGLAIAKGMEAQIGGIRTAVQNAEDGINLIRTADGSLSETQDILLRMRDLSVRAANEATLTSADLTRLDNEFQSLVAELDRKADAVTFNTKNLFNGDFAGGQVLQIGPDNAATYQLTVTIQSLSSAAGLGLGDDLTTLANAQAAITAVQSALDIVSDIRANLGIQERRLGHIIDDLKAADINISAAKSRIYDADMAVEISEFTRLQILQQSGTAILAQANAQPQSVLQLLK